MQVLDRGTPVARLIPTAARDDDGVRDLLVRKGLIRPGTGRLGAIPETPPVVVSARLLRALDEDRDDRLLMQEQLPGPLTFVCLDRRLAEAAELESLRVLS